MTINSTRTNAAIAAILASTALGACDFTEGEEGNLYFNDTTLGDVDLGDRLAVGATVVVTVDDPWNQSESVDAVRSSNPGVVEVVGFAGDTITLRGVAAGTSVVEAEVDGVVDRVTIEVAEVADASVRLMPWPSLAELPSSLWAQGFAMLPSSRVEVRAFPRDGSGARTTGFGAIVWTADGGAEVEIAPDRRSDTVAVVAPATAGEFTVTPSVGDAQPMSVVEAAAVSSVSLYSSHADGTVVEDGGTITIASNEALILHLAAFTEDGSYVAGDGGVLVQWQTSGGAEGLLEDLMDTLASDGESAAEVRATFARGLLLGATGNVGSGTLTVSWGERSVAVNLEVVAPAEPQGGS